MKQTNNFYPTNKISFGCWHEQVLLATAKLAMLASYIIENIHFPTSTKTGPSLILADSHYGNKTQYFLFDFISCVHLFILS